MILVTHLLDSFSHLGVSISWLDQSQGSLSSLISCQSDISFNTHHRNILVRLHRYCMGSQSNKTVNMSSQFDFHQIPLLNVSRVLGKWGIVAHDLVGTDGSWEGKTFEGRFFVVDLRQLFVDLTVRPQAQLKDLGTYYYFFDQPSENI